MAIILPVATGWRNFFECQFYAYFSRPLIKCEVWDGLDHVYLSYKPQLAIKTTYQDQAQMKHQFKYLPVYTLVTQGFVRFWAS